MYIPKEAGIWAEKNAGLTPEVMESCLTERLDAWAKAFEGVEHKLAWVGAGNDGGAGNHDYRPVARSILDRAYELGTANSIVKSIN